MELCCEEVVLLLMAASVAGGVMWSSIVVYKGSLGAAVKLLPCDHEVTGSSPGNSLLQKCRERLRTKDPVWSDPSPDPAQAGATCTGLPFLGSIY